MAHFHPLRVTEIRTETEQSVSILLDPQGKGDDFKFIPGQYLTFKITTDGEEHRRSYSICSAPTENELRVGVKAVEDGTISVFLNQSLSVGDEIQSMVPMGNFHPNESADSRQKHFILFAAGSGITPILSIIKWAMAHPMKHKATLFYGNTGRDTVMFHDELAQMTQANEALDVIHIFSDRSSGAPTTSGRIDFAKTWELVNAMVHDNLAREYFVCGPSGMMKSVQESLVDLSIPKEAIHMEHFSEPDAEDQAPIIKVAEEVPSDWKGDAKIIVELDDEEEEFTLASSGIVILDAAIDANIDAPYSCKGGVCTTCKAKLKEGKVNMDSNYALTDGEIADGYILTCQSHPASPTVRISYDDI
jgi:ring-1,2-phenylacetyl-CoA epoxidase subunit PaaE